MKKSEFLEILTNFAKDYSKIAKESIWQNNHMNNIKEDIITQDEVEAILVDYINYIALKNGVDYGLYVVDLKKD